MRISHFVFLSGMTLLSASVHSATFQYSVNTNVLSSDNLSQRQDGEDGTANIFGFNFAINSSLTKEWLVDITSTYNYIDYSVDELASEQSKNFQGYVNYLPEKSNFSLALLQSISQTPRDRFQTEEVNNLRDVEVSAVTPSYFIRLDPVNRINFSATYLDMNSEDSQGLATAQNNSQINEIYSVGYENQINATNRISLNARHTRTEFDDASAIDYSQRDYFFRWQMDGSTNQMTLEYGEASITDDLFQKSKVDLSRLIFTRQMNRSQSLELRYVQGFDTILNGNQANNAVNQQNNGVAAAQAIDEQAVTYRFGDGSFSMAIDAFKRKLTQAFSTNSEVQEGYSANMGLSLTRLFNTPLNRQLQITYTKTDNTYDIQFSNFTGADIETAQVTYNHSYSQNLAFSFSWIDRTSVQTDINGNFLDNSSESFMIGFVYSDNGRW